MCCGVLVLTLTWIFSRDYPLVGHDFRYFVPRLIDTDLHIRLNGLAAQWWTASFGGGLPAFANPQHMQYSLVQAMVFFSTPWTGFLISTAVIASVAFWAFYRFLIDMVGLQWVPALLGAVFFIGNGFYIEHLIVGHVTFQPYPLVAVLLFALTDRRFGPMFCGGLVALISSLTIHNGGFYVLILMAASLVLTLLLLDLCRRGVVDMRLARVAAVAAALSLALCASKIYATLSLMRQIPREIADVYPVGLAQALAGFVAELLGAMILVPALMAVGIEGRRIEGMMSKLTGASVQVGVWELDTGLSPLVTAALAIGVGYWLMRVRRLGWPTFQRRQLVTAAAILVVAWVGVEATLARGLVYPFLRQLPILRSLHVNHRIASIYILPLTLVGTILIDAWYRQTPRRWLAVPIVLAALACPGVYLLLPARVHLRTFDLTQSEFDHAQVRAGERFPIERIDNVPDAEVFSKRASSLGPFDGLFGYGNETFKSELRAGDARAVTDGHFNMMNPSSLVFPELNDAYPFEPLRVDQREELEALLARRQPGFTRPALVTWLGWLSLAALGVTVAALIGAVPAALRTRKFPPVS